MVRELLRKDEKNKLICDPAYEWGEYKGNHRNGQSWIPYLNHDCMPGRVCPLGLRDELAGTWAQFSGLDVYAEKSRCAVREEYYLQSWLKRPEIEMVSKGGLFRLAVEMVNGHYYYFSETRFDMNTLKRHLKDLRKHNGGVNAVRALAAMDKTGRKIDPAEIIRFANKNGDEYTSLPYLVRFASIKKINDYLEASKQRAASDLRDYWHMQEALGANMTETKTLFPRNLEKAHGEAVKAYNAYKDKLDSKALGKVARRLAEEFSFTFGGLMIVIPFTMEDLTNEGKTLNHCVRTYGKKMAAGETAIMFVRKVEEPGTPYFTMEVKDGKIVQLRGKGNCAPRADVVAFEKKFCEACHLMPLSA